MLIRKWKQSVVKEKRTALVKEKINKILVLSIFGGIGDNLIFSSIFCGLKTLLPNAIVDIAGVKAFIALNQFNPYIRKSYTLRTKKNGKLYKNIFFDIFELYKMKKEKYDLLIDLRGSSSFYMFFLYDFLKTPYLMAAKSKKLNKQLGLDDSFLCRYNCLASSISDYLLAIDNNYAHNDRYDFFLSLDGSKKAKFFLKTVPQDSIIIIFNTEGAKSGRCLKKNKIIEIILGLSQLSQVKIILTFTPTRKKLLAKILNDLNLTNVQLAYDTNLDTLGALIYYSDILVSPDSGPIHIASAFNKKIVGIYANNLENIDFWKPKCDDYRLVTPEIMSHNDTIDEFSCEKVIEAVKEMMTKFDKQ